MYRTILFDFDGTVFDTGLGVMKSVQYAANAFGFSEENYNDLRCFVGPPLKEMLMKRYGVDEKTAKAMIAKYRERYNVTGLAECAPYPGVFDLVHRLRARGMTVAVATGKPTEFTVKILSAYGQEELFDDVLGSEFDGTRSQKWEVIEELMRRHGSDGVVMIGDRDNDVLGAKKCGVPCIGVSWGYAEPGELLGAGAIALADTPEELETLLCR